MTQSPAKKSFFNRNVDLMNGPIFKSLFVFMLPILVSCLFQRGRRPLTRKQGYRTDKLRSSLASKIQK